MRTVLAVLLAAGVATAALPPHREVKTYDATGLVGEDGFFATADELLIVVKAYLAGRRTADAPHVVWDGPGKKLAVTDAATHDDVTKFLDTFRRAKERRKLSVLVECLVVRTPAGRGERMMLPTDAGKPMVLTEKEAALTLRLLRFVKAEGNADVLSRPSMVLAHGREGVVEVAEGEWQTDFSTLRAGYRQTLTATVNDDGKTVALSAAVSNSRAVEFFPRVSHEGKFAADVPVGGTAVAKVPGKDATDDLYVFLTANIVHPAAKVGTAATKAELPPVPVVAVPPATVCRVWEPLGERALIDRLPLVPPTVIAAGGLTPQPASSYPAHSGFVLVDGKVYLPTDMLPKPPRVASPFRTVWDDLGPLKPLPAIPWGMGYPGDWSWLGGQ